MFEDEERWAVLPVWGRGERGMTTREFAEEWFFGDRRRAMACLERGLERGVVRRVMSSRGWRWWRVERWE